jgi:hypothetical protein
VDVDWTAPHPEHFYGLSPEWSTPFGTPLWDGLTEEQRVALTLHEYCSISGVGIWFECLLMQLVLRDIYGDDPAQPHVQWALVVEEARHMRFAREEIARRTSAAGSCAGTAPPSRRWP